MGSVHHVAFRAQSDEDELFMRERIHMIGEMPTPVIDRNYFHSVYFVTPGRVLFEIATDGPGFSIDEEVDALGERLVLPPQYERHRAEIEAILEPVELPRTKKTI
jgi:glyoxalase family protein